MITDENFFNICKEHLVEYYNNHSDNFKITINDTFLVWSCKTLQNRKCIMGSYSPDLRLYEFSLNGDKKQIYMDVYNKVDKYVLKLEEKNI